MSEEDNRTIAERFGEDVWGSGDLDAMDEMFAPDYVDHGAPPGEASGREWHKGLVVMFRTAFPDLAISNEDVITSGDKVVLRWTGRGTHEGELMGIAPTGKEVEFSGIEVLRVVEGKVVERWGEGNDLEIMQQLGVVPVPD
jgi:predicted ester cyclase